MVGPANGVSNYLALGKIYCTLILQIRALWPPELRVRKTIIAQRWGWGGGSRAPQDQPPATPKQPGVKKVQNDILS